MNRGAPGAAGVRKRKVRYVELIYDLVFIYLIKRSDGLLSLDAAGFFGAAQFNEYILSNLVVMQIWVSSTLFVNRYGRDGFRTNLFVFINMYLLYYMAAGTAPDWTTYFVSYQTAWALITANLMVQYAARLRTLKDGAGPERRYLKRRLVLFAAQIACVLGLIPVFGATRLALVWVPLGVGFFAELTAGYAGSITPISSEHLTERAMLFILLTFGETFISLAGYFEGGFDPGQLYFSACGFLIVIGMVMGYGYLYENVIDREGLRRGGAHLLAHLFLAIAVNDMTIGLEFMREPESDGFLSTAFMVDSFLVYFACLGVIAVRSCGKKAPGAAPVAPVLLSFGVAASAMLLYENRAATAALSIVYVYLMLHCLKSAGRRPGARLRIPGRLLPRI